MISQIKKMAFHEIEQYQTDCTYCQIDQLLCQLNGVTYKEPKILDENKLTLDFLIYLSYFTMLTIHYLNQMISVSKNNKFVFFERINIMNDNEKTSDIIEEIDDSALSDFREHFDPPKIDITVKPLIINSLIKRMKSEPMRIDLNTEFQQMGNLWPPDTQSRLIESLLVGIPIPAFYFDGTDDNNWKIVDGLQRITTLKNFIIDRTLKLTGLDYLKQYEGMGFDELPFFLQGRIEETQITAFIINPGTPGEVKYNIFKRINTGGLILTTQEIRHALNQGIPADFVKELALLEEFRQATDYALDGCKRMEDRDFVTRFIGFYLGYDSYQPDLDSFLNKAMAKLNELNSSERKKVKNDFIKAMKAAYDIFGNDAFRKRYHKIERRKPLNKALFDSWSVNLAKLSNEELKILISKKDKLKNRLIEIMNSDERFQSSISSATGDLKAVKIRFDTIKNLIREIINDKTN